MFKAWSKRLLNKVSVLYGVAHEDIKQIVFSTVRLKGVVLTSFSATCLAVQPLFDAGSEGEGKEVSNDNHENCKENRDKDGSVVHGGGSAGLEVWYDIFTTNNTFNLSDGFALEVISNTSELIFVNDLTTQFHLECHEGVKKVALTGPHVASQVKSNQHWVVDQPPGGKCCQEVSIQSEHRQRSEGVESF